VWPDISAEAKFDAIVVLITASLGKQRCMTSLARQLSSLTSLPKILSDSLVTALAETDSDSLAYRLVPRPVYPIKLAIAAEGLALVRAYA
jgi:hypothetical protein